MAFASPRGVALDAAHGPSRSELSPAGQLHPGHRANGGQASLPPCRAGRQPLVIVLDFPRISTDFQGFLDVY